MKPEHPELFEQGLLDQARVRTGKIGVAPDAALLSDKELVRAAHTRWINGKPPKDDYEHHLRILFAQEPDIYGTVDEPA